MAKVIKLTESDLRRIIKESVKMIIMENCDFRKGSYDFYDTCVNMDAEDLQNITHYDPFADNEYCIDDDYFNEDVFVISYDDFKRLVGNDPQPSKEEIEYCAYNANEDVLFAYTVDDIHWIYT